MPEPLPENKDELNQMCKKYLLEKKEVAYPTVLYCLQLIEWGLDKVANVRDSRLRNTLEELIGSNQKESYRFLKVAEDGEEYEPVPDLETVESAEDLAERLVDVLDSKLNLHFPDYPIARSLE